jgi:hypothetical protein
MFCSKGLNRKWLTNNLIPVKEEQNPPRRMATKPWCETNFGIQDYPKLGMVSNAATR